MANIAEIGFRADTDELDIANQKMKALKPSAEGVEKASENLNEKLNKTNSVFGKLAAGGNTVNGVFGKLAAGVKTLAGGLLGIVTGAIAVFAFANMISGARELSSAFAELSTLMPNATAELNDMKLAARGMADEFGTSAAFQAKAFYGAVSAGATTAAAAIDIVDTANRLAIGGITDVATGVDILTTSTNAYANAGLTASDASDALFVGMKAGKTTIGELASGLGNVIPIASALGVEFTELVAATSALTLQGLSTSTAITSLRAILSGIAKPTSEASKMAKELGIDFSTTALRTKGLAGFLQDVVNKTGGSADKLSVLFGSVEALNAALAFAGQGGADFTEIIESMGDKAGATGEAFEIVAQSLDYRWGKLLSQLNNIAIDFGYTLLSILVPAAEKVAAAFKIVADNTDFLIIAMIALAYTQMPALIVGFTRLAFALTSYNALAAYSATLSYALGAAMYAIPFVAVVAGLTLAYRWLTSSGEAADMAAGAIGEVDGSSAQLSDTLVGVINGLKQTEEQLLSITQTEAMIAQAKQAEELEQSLIQAKEGVFKLALEARNMGEAIDPSAVGLIYNYMQAFKGGEQDAIKLNRALDAIARFNPNLAPFVAELQASVGNSAALNGKLDRSNALIAFLEGKATDAQKAMLGITQTNIATAIGAGANEAARLAQNLGISLDTATKLAAMGPQGATPGAGMGRGGDPRTMGGSGFDWQNREADVFLKNYKDPSAGGSGGGGGSAMAEEITQLQKLQEEYSKLLEPLNQAESAYSALDDALQNGVINNDQFTESLSRIQEAFLATGGTAQQWAKIVNSQTDSVANKMKSLGEKALTDLGDQFINLAVDGEASFGDLAKSIIKDLLKIAWQALVVKPLLESLGNLGGGGGGGGFFGKLFGALFSAKGNAFDGSGVSAFAKGSAFSNTVVNGATPFLFGKGGADLGIMGEAGPEAVMPLQRGADGSLGVQMYGGGGGAKQVKNDVSVTNIYKIEGAVSEDKVIQTIRSQGEKTKEDVRQSVVGWLATYEQDGTM